MKLIICSDTHASTSHAKEALCRELPIDGLIHLGDYVQDALEIQGWLACPLYQVRGNCDYGSDLPSVMVLSLSGYNFFLTHGDRYHVKQTLDLLVQASLEKNCSIALFGHTHQSVLEWRQGCLILNPGSLSLPRAGQSPSFAVLEIKDDIPQAHIVTL